MKHIRILLAASALLVAVPASAQDLVKMTIGQRGNWDTAIPHLGEKAGIFKKHGLTLEMLYTSGSGETVQPVVSGNVDLGLAVGTLGAIGYFAKGAPIRIVSAQATGAADYWYTKAESPLKTLKDAKGQTIAYSTNGSSTHSMVLAFIKEWGIDAKPTATGNPSATLTAVMTNQVDIGWAAPPFGLKEIAEGKIKLLEQGRRDQDHRRADGPHHHRQPGLAEEPQGRPAQVHGGLSRDDRLHVFEQPAGDYGLRGVRQDDA